MAIRAGSIYSPLPHNAPKIIKIIFEEKRRQGISNMLLSEKAGIAHTCITNLKRVANGVRFNTAQLLLNALGLPSYEEFYEDWIRRGRPQLNARDVSKGQVSEPKSNQTQNVVATEMR